MDMPSWLPMQHALVCWKDHVGVPGTTRLGAYAGVPRVVEEQLQGGQLDVPAVREAAAAAVAPQLPAPCRCAPCTGSRSGS